MMNKPQPNNANCTEDDFWDWHYTHVKSVIHSYYRNRYYTTISSNEIP